MLKIIYRPIPPVLHLVLHHFAIFCTYTAIFAHIPPYMHIFAKVKCNPLKLEIFQCFVRKSYFVSCFILVWFVVLLFLIQCFVFNLFPKVFKFDFTNFNFGFQCFVINFFQKVSKIPSLAQNRQFNGFGSRQVGGLGQSLGP